MSREIFNLDNAQHVEEIIRLLQNDDDDPILNDDFGEESDIASEDVLEKRDGDSESKQECETDKENEDNLGTNFFLEKGLSNPKLNPRAPAGKVINKRNPKGNLNERDIEDYLSKLEDGWLSEDGLDDQDSDDENRDADEVIRVLQEENDDDDVDETADIDPPLVEPEDQESSHPSTSSNLQVTLRVISSEVLQFVEQESFSRKFVIAEDEEVFNLMPQM
ncbi:hypothetical protein FQA39_LY14412 [Lamprigera yunnana]|nr:hypothetical protein FQA39_LY14412 [Lamprigera yunnana]